MKKKNNYAIISLFSVVLSIFMLFSMTAYGEEWAWTQGTLSQELKKGDVNNDGMVDVKDASEFLNLLVGNYKVHSMHYNSADINGDEKISVRDGLLLVQNLAKIRDDDLGYEDNLKDITYYVPESFSEGGEMLTSDKPLAFYGADGYGKYTAGGRGGRIIYVTNLKDSGEGSFRAACEASGKRIIVFRVSGVIYLSKGISVKGDCTIAGETAPGDGITLANGTLQISGDNVILRYLTVRPGDQAGEEYDGIDIKCVHNVIVDHCSVSAGVDENLSVAAGSGDKFCNNVTVQWCNINQSITMSPNNGKRHGMGSIVTSGLDGKVSYHHNYLSSNSSRNPMMRSSSNETYDNLGANIELANNVIYNWQGDCGSKTAPCDDNGLYRSIVKINMLNNYYKQGPDSTDDYMLSESCIGCSLYAAGNMMNGKLIENNMDYIYLEQDVLQNEEENPYYVQLGMYWKEENYFLKERFADSALSHLQSAEKAMEDIMLYSGNSRSRDTFDVAFAEEFKNGEGHLINQIFESSGWIYPAPSANTGSEYFKEIMQSYPNRASYPAYQDSDEDGMSDAWEDFMGLDKTDKTDGPASFKGTEYTNLDVFLQFLVENPEAAIAK